MDYTNVLRERGLSRFDALLKAGPTRLRPILMTTFAMIFGMVPVALALGEGAEFQSPDGTSSNRRVDYLNTANVIYCPCSLLNS